MLICGRSASSRHREPFPPMGLFVRCRPAKRPFPASSAWGFASGLCSPAPQHPLTAPAFPRPRSIHGPSEPQHKRPAASPRSPGAASSVRDTNRRAYSGQVINLPRGPSDAGPANRRHQPCAGRSPRGLCHQDDGLQDARKRLQKPSFRIMEAGRCCVFEQGSDEVLATARQVVPSAPRHTRPTRFPFWFPCIWYTVEDTEQVIMQDI